MPPTPMSSRYIWIRIDLAIAVLLFSLILQETCIVSALPYIYLVECPMRLSTVYLKPIAQLV